MVGLNRLLHGVSRLIIFKKKTISKTHSGLHSIQALLNYCVFIVYRIGKAIGTTPGEYKEFLYEPNVSLFSNGSLHFKKITKEAQGHFLCEAKNNIGAGVSKVIFLKVNGTIKLQTLFLISFIFKN